MALDMVVLYVSMEKGVGAIDTKDTNGEVWREREHKNEGVWRLTWTFEAPLPAAASLL
jgi:hypothetical protein